MAGVETGIVNVGFGATGTTTGVGVGLADTTGEDVVGVTDVAAEVNG